MAARHHFKCGRGSVLKVAFINCLIVACNVKLLSEVGSSPTSRTIVVFPLETSADAAPVTLLQVVSPLLLRCWQWW